MRNESIPCLPVSSLPRALHVVQNLAIEKGGPSIAVPALALATDETGRYTNSILHFGPTHAAGPRQSGVIIQDCPCGRIDLMLPTRERTFLREAVSRSDIAQVHGIWAGHSAATLDFATRFGKPIIVSAHGMLDGWALRQKKWKKLLYSLLVERPKLSRATCLRALTRVEGENYRSFGLGQPVAIIPNGVAAPDDVSPNCFLEHYPHLRGKRILLFFGRIHKKKGVDLLVKAWRLVSGLFPDTDFVIAGPDDGALQEVLPQCSGRFLAESMTICGMLTGELRWSAIAAASAFALPSHSEGLSMALLEALWYGVPVLITRECNFREIEGLPCTFLVKPNVSSIAEGLSALLSRPAVDLQVRGQCGARFVRSCYGWPVVGRKMADVYDWMLGGSVPSSVEML